MELVKEYSETLEEFKRLVGRVIVETDENRKVNEEEAKRICLHLQRYRNFLIREGGLEWDSSADTFTNTLDNTVIETDPTAKERHRLEIMNWKMSNLEGKWLEQ